MADNFAAIDGNNNPVTMRSKDVGSGVQAQITFAGEHTRVYDGVQTLTLTTSAQSLTVPGSATHAMIYCEGAAGTDYARYWHGATAPTATTGKKLKDHEEIATAKPSDFQAIIGSGGGSPKLLIEYYHYP